MAQKPMTDQRRNGPGTLEDRFQKRLMELSGGKAIAVTNKAMREALGWDDERYEAIKNKLIAKKTIRVAVGHGGMVRFVEVPTSITAPRRLKAFISYCHADEKIKN